MTAFVERGGDPCQKHPCEVEQVTAHGFKLSADREALDALIDRHLNAPIGTPAFQAAGSWVVLLAACLGRARNASSAGFLPDVDISFWVPLRSTGALPDAATFSFLIPYTFVSSGHGIAMGREIFGFNKMLSAFEIPQPLPTNGEMTRIAVKTVAMKELDADAQARFETVLQVEPSAADGDGAVDTTTFWEELQPMLRLNEPQALPEGGLSDLLKGVQGVFLRQLRDVSDPTRAAFQSVVQVPVKARHLPRTRFGRLQGSALVTLPPFESHPIAEELGLALDEMSRIQSSFDFWVEFEFEIGLGKTLWAARP